MYISKSNRTGSIRVNVTPECIRVTIIAVEKKNYYKFWMCVCSLRYQECSAHAPYYVVFCGVSGRSIFFRIIS